MPSICPEFVQFDLGFRDSPEWGSASVLLPWYLYKKYGDRQLLEKHYGLSERYVAYLLSKARNGILNYGLGDWLDVGHYPSHPANTPIPITATAILYQDLTVMAETAGVLGRKEEEEHYRKLHPEKMSLEVRKNCLYDLKKLGYQVGAGMMVGSPYQTTEDLAEDLVFLKKLQPEMVGIGPFIPHHDTQFAKEPAGSVEMTLFLLAVIRILLPKVLLPATTALGTMDPLGREKGLQAGANVVMPNLSPVSVRKKYMLYDGKICTGDEAAECRMCLSRRMEQIGCEVVTDRGDYKKRLA